MTHTIDFNGFRSGKGVGDINGNEESVVLMGVKFVVYELLITDDKAHFAQLLRFVQKL